jgi:hypothetical protein
MSQEEVSMILDAQYEEYQERWNQIRFLCYVTAASSFGGSKVKSPKELMKFPWDEEEQLQLTPEQKKLNAEELVQVQYDLINSFHSTEKTPFKFNI